jgi:hypothetical protein
LTKGIYSDPNVVLKSKQTRFYSDEDFKFPLPEVFPAESDFELSYDLEYMVDELGGTAGMNGSSETEKPSKFQWIPKSKFLIDQIFLLTANRVKMTFLLYVCVKLDQEKRLVVVVLA